MTAPAMESNVDQLEQKAEAAPVTRKSSVPVIASQTWLKGEMGSVPVPEAKPVVKFPKVNQSASTAKPSSIYPIYLDPALNPKGVDYRRIGDDNLEQIMKLFGHLPPDIGDEPKNLQTASVMPDFFKPYGVASTSSHQGLCWANYNLILADDERFETAVDLSHLKWRQHINYPGPEWKREMVNGEGKLLSHMAKATSRMLRHTASLKNKSCVSHICRNDRYMPASGDMTVALRITPGCVCMI